MKTRSDRWHIDKWITMVAAALVCQWAAQPAQAASVENLAPEMRLIQPTDGSTFELGSPITLNAEAIDADGYASYAEFFANGDKIGDSQIMFFRAPDPGTPIQHSYEWSPANPGQYELTAVAFDDQGAEGISPKVTITVKAPVNHLPRIADIWLDHNEVVVQCLVPAGVRKVTLESRLRLGAGAWTPRAVQRLDGTATSLTFRLEQSAALEILRVRTDSEEALPAQFYEGKTNYLGQGSAYDQSRNSLVYDILAPTEKEGENGASREVVESDIWKLDGQTMYLFNEYRGLQVIDLSNIDSPVIEAELALPASGEQMYLLDDTHVVLLAQDRYSSTNGVQSAVIVVDVSGPPQVVSRLPVTGTIMESRLVGTALYVATQYYREVPLPPKDPNNPTVSTTWEWGSLIASFDLADPEAAVARDSIWLSGYGNVIYATEELLFAANQDPVDYWQSMIHVIDISSPDGRMSELTMIRPAGAVANKFRMNMANDVFTVVSEQWNRQTGTRRVSVLQTFSMVDPAAPVAMGKLEVGQGEGLYATRFDGDRAYIVTYLRIDPLWVVDLRDPAKPTLSGELHVPGWSTFIYPWGDRLVTIGIDDTNSWRVAVSLFDVADPTKPGLLAKIPLGENYSWSEANSDERALSVLPNAGLVLVPYQSWDTNGYVSRVQLIDLEHDTLRARGVIDHTMQPRRATQHLDRILSVSGRELLVVNAVDRDHPQVTAELELSWPVNQVILSGDYLIEISNEYDWRSLPNPILHVANRITPEKLLFTYRFTNQLPIMGATLKDNRLYVLQGNQTTYYYALPNEEGSKDGVYRGKAVLSVFDVAQLPQLQILGQGAMESPIDIDGTFQALWPQQNLLVWASSGGGYRPWMYRGLMLDVFYPWRWGTGGRMLAFNVASSSAPQFVSEVNLQGTNSWWSFSRAQVTGGMIYLSHQGSEFLPDVTPSWYQKPSPIITSKEDGTLVTNYPPVGIWVSKYYLDVIDYADPANPTARKPVNIPGELIGTGAAGSLIYTVGPHYNAEGASDGIDYLDVGAYDGVAVALVDSLALTNSWPRPIMLSNGQIMLLQTNPELSMQAWELSLTGRLAMLGQKKLDWAPSSWRAFDKLLVLQGYTDISLYDVTAPAAPAFLKSGSPWGWTYPDLDDSDGDLAKGLSMPLGDYGVFSIFLDAKP